MNHYSAVTEIREIEDKRFPQQHPTGVWAKNQHLAEYLYGYHGIAYLYIDVTVGEVDASDLGGALGKLCNGFYPELN